MNTESAASQLDTFIERYSPDIAATAREVLQKLSYMFPGAHQLVYDNYNALAIGFSASDKLSETVISVALFPRWVSLFFFDGTKLPDPGRVLRGTGKRARHIVLTSSNDLDRPEIVDLLNAAVAFAGGALAEPGSGGLVIKSISESQSPRIPANVRPR